MCGVGSGEGSKLMIEFFLFHVLQLEHSQDYAKCVPVDYERSEQNARCLNEVKLKISIKSILQYPCEGL